MARNLQTFESSNRLPPRAWRPSSAELFLDQHRPPDRPTFHRGRQLLHRRQDRARLAAEGSRRDAEEPYKSFADDVERTRSEFLAVAARRMGQLAIGGVPHLAQIRQDNQLVRDADGEIEWEERYFPPNVNALAHVLDRIDPEPNLVPPGPGLPGAPILSDAEALAKATVHFDLILDALTIMVQLGVPLEQILQQQTIEIETTATAAPAEPAKESEPAPIPSAATIAATIETDPSDKPPEAF